MFNNDRVTCISPWYSLRIEPSGEYRYCDFEKTKEASPMLPSQWFQSGTNIVNARHQIQQGTPLQGCSQCYYQEKIGFNSYRHRKNIQGAVHSGQYFKESLCQSPARDRLTRLQNVGSGPAFLHVSLGNLCNLACRMCHSEYSSRVTAVHKKIQLVPASTPVLVDWTSDIEKWEDFCQNLVINNTSLICLHFMGGEPLLHDKFFEVLQRCVDANYTDFHLTFVTNGTMWKDSYMELFSKFKSVAIEISIENFHSTSNYVRFGSDYQVIKNNITNIVTHKPESISVALRTVPQALTIEHYDTLIDFALQHELNVDANLLIHPPELALSVLPLEVKLQLAEHFESKYKSLLSLCVSPMEVSDFRNHHHHRRQIAHHVQSLVELLTATEVQQIEELRCNFVDYNKKFDRATGQNFAESYPNLIKFYEKYHNNNC